MFNDAWVGHQMQPNIPGFITQPELSASGKVYAGRFTCPGVQWTGAGADAFSTFTITAAELADACEGRILWTDQSVQRGIKSEFEKSAERELALADGYPDESKYIFNSGNADEIVEKLLSGKRLFLNPLIWNLRPSSFSAFYNQAESEIYLYNGKVFLPDSHHRHQAIFKAVKLWRESPGSYPNFSGSHQFKVELYFLDKSDEGNYFFDKNQRPRPTAKSKAYDLTTADDLSLLAKRVIEYTPALKGNVNRVTDRLDSKNPSVMTLSTLREMMRTFAASEEIDEAELDGMAIVASDFYSMLVEIRPELGHLPLQDRKRARSSTLAESAVTMHGYAALMRDFSDDIGRMGRSKAIEWWKFHLQALRPGIEVSFDHWDGDFFAKDNPLWQRVGIVRPSIRTVTVSNTGGARAAMGKILRAMVRLDSDPVDISQLLG